MRRGVAARATKSPCTRGHYGLQSLFLGAPGGDAGRGGLPAGVDGLAGLVDVDEERSVIRRDRRPLARLAIDLGADRAGRDDLGHEQVIDAHAVVLVEVAGAVIPPA